MTFDHLTDDELVVIYNAAPKPNPAGDELLRRIHLRDQREVAELADYHAKLVRVEVI